MLEFIVVHGCVDMRPPDGAWMTRDGDVIDIGCHSGSKTWRLECEENQWVGSVGFCGKNIKDPRSEIRIQYLIM